MSCTSQPRATSKRRIIFVFNLQDQEVVRLKSQLTEMNDELAREKARARLWETMFVADKVNQENTTQGEKQTIEIH